MKRWGLALDASTGKVSGQVIEPQQVECTVTAKEGEGLPVVGVCSYGEPGWVWWVWWMGVMGFWAGNILGLLFRSLMFLNSIQVFSRPARRRCGIQCHLEPELRIFQLRLEGLELCRSCTKAGNAWERLAETLRSKRSAKGFIRIKSRKRCWRAFHSKPVNLGVWKHVSWIAALHFVEWGTVYSSWSVACTPSAPWLKISNDGALYRQGGGVPFAASCLVTAVQGNMNHTLKAGNISFLQLCCSVEWFWELELSFALIFVWYQPQSTSKRLGSGNSEKTWAGFGSRRWYHWRILKKLSKSLILDALIWDLPGGCISSLWVGIYALGPCSTTRSAC